MPAIQVCFKKYNMKTYKSAKYIRKTIVYIKNISSGFCLSACTENLYKHKKYRYNYRGGITYERYYRI